MPPWPPQVTDLNVLRFKTIKVLVEITKEFSIKQYRKDLGNSTNFESRYFKKGL